MKKPTMPTHPIAVDRPCDIHFIEALARGMKETVHCKMWGKVKKKKRDGVLYMDCPQPECCPTKEDIDKKCNFKLWEEM